MSSIETSGPAPFWPGIHQDDTHNDEPAYDDLTIPKAGMAVDDTSRSALGRGVGYE
jgi:hypothetical protein